jgi:outer membrane protein OmpA-like peptidoglycan-associated protein
MAEAALGRDGAPGPGARPHTSDESADPELSELRSILVGPEQRELRALELHLHDEARRTREVSRVLPEALTLRSRDSQLAAALGPMVEEAITASVHRDPRPLANALFPVMGPAIRRAIEHMFASMMESFSRTVEQRVSWRALRWRLTAWRTGRPFSEIVLLNTLQYRVEQVFLIHAESGLLLQHVTADAVPTQDADQVSAMMTAIRDFVRDSFNVAGPDGLDAFRVGALTVLIEQGPYAILAGVVRGAPPPDVRLMFRHALESIHRLLGPEMQAFDGDAAEMEKARPTLESCLVSHLHERPAPSYRRWVAAAALILLGIGVWSFFVVRERQRFGAYVDRLAAEPGIVVLSSGRRDGRFVVTGLRDPLAGDPAALLAPSGVEASRVEQHWQPYEAIQPAFVAARATALLRPPPGVTLAFRDGVLAASGAAPERWLIDSERVAPAIGGVRRFEYAGASAVDQLTRKLEAVSILFPRGRSELSPEQLARVASAASLVSLLNEALRVRRQSAQIAVVGHTDSDGSEVSNGPLSQARADAVIRILGATAVDAVTFASRGIGVDDPASTGTGELDKARNRRTSLRVTIADQANAGSRP